MDIIRAARLDCGTFPIRERERTLMKDAGITEICEVAGYDSDEIAKIDPDVIIFISGYVPRKTIEKLNRCRAIFRLGIGYDKIDLHAATEKGIIACNTTGYCVHEVAEHTLALMLGCARRIPQASASMKDGTWPEVTKRLGLRRIYGKTAGIIGLGAIGKCIAEALSGFHMKILFHGGHPSDEEISRCGAVRVDLESLLKESDFVFLSCPANEKTRGMIGKEQLALMKNTAILINTARGSLVDEKALAEALKDKQIDYAGIDVYEHINIWGEIGNPPEGYYHGIDNILMTPHISYISEESDLELYDAGYGQVKIFLNGGWPNMCVNPQVRGKAQ